MSDLIMEITIRVHTHGTPGGYSRGCRCDLCSQAAREYRLRLREERARRLDEAPHGTNGGYCNWGCRCTPCKQAHATATRDYRNGLSM